MMLAMKHFGTERAVHQVQEIIIHAVAVFPYMDWVGTTNNFLYNLCMISNRFMKSDDCTLSRNLLIVT